MGLRYHAGRPLKFWRKKLDACGVQVLVATFLVGAVAFGVWTNFAWWREQPGWKPAALLIAGLAVLGALTRFFARGFAGLARDGGRIVPYFRKPVAGRIGAGTSLGGVALAAHCERLDALAQTAGLEPLSAFGYADDMDGERITWHDAGAGLRTIEGLLGVVGTMGPQDATVREELVQLRDALLRARDAQVPFSLIVRFEHDATNGMEWEQRQGTIW